MSRIEIHILNVGQGDCTLFRSSSGNWTLVDICGGNKEPELREAYLAKVRGNFRMCQYPTNPIDYLANVLGDDPIFRFILTHPDMDHLDGFDNLCRQFTIANFWDSGVRRTKPDFEKGGYNEADWNHYVVVRDGKTSINVVYPLAGARQKYWNLDDKDGWGDYIVIYAPTDTLVSEANKNADSKTNDASYVIAHWTPGGRILLPGDAHNATWEHILAPHASSLTHAEFMLAPHHGRDSGRSWEFLDKLQPKFSLLGCAASKDLAYDQWNKRNLLKITQNQAGNVVIYPIGDEGLDVYVENSAFAHEAGGKISRTDGYGNFFLYRIEKA